MISARVARRDAELAFLAGGDDHLRLAVEDLFLGADDVAADGGHVVTRFARKDGSRIDREDAYGTDAIRADPVPVSLHQAAFFSIVLAFSNASSMPPTM